MGTLPVTLDKVGLISRVVGHGDSGSTMGKGSYGLVRSLEALLFYQMSRKHLICNMAVCLFIYLCFCYMSNVVGGRLFFIWSKVEAL